MNNSNERKIRGTCQCKFDDDSFYRLIMENNNFLNEIENNELYKLIKEMSISLATEVINCAVSSGCTEHIECSEFGKCLIRTVTAINSKR